MQICCSVMSYDCLVFKDHVVTLRMYQQVVQYFSFYLWIHLSLTLTVGLVVLKLLKALPSNLGLNAVMVLIMRRHQQKCTLITGWADKTPFKSSRMIYVCSIQTGQAGGAPELSTICFNMTSYKKKAKCNYLVISDATVTKLSKVKCPFPI